MIPRRNRDVDGEVNKRSGKSESEGAMCWQEVIRVWLIYSTRTSSKGRFGLMYDRWTDRSILLCSFFCAH